MADDFGFQPDEENDDFGFVPEETSKADISSAESALRGAERGLTFDFADELSGVIGAGLEGVSGAVSEGSLAPLSDNNLARIYSEYRDAARNRYDAAEQTNPKATFAGQMVGGMLVPVGAAGTLAKGASTASKIKTGSAIGAGMGAVGSAGASDAPILSPEFAGDVAIGAGVGTVLGAGTPIAADYAIKPVAKATGEGLAWTSDRLFGPVKDAFNRGLDKLNLVTEAGQKAGMKKVGTAAEAVPTAIQGELRDLASLKANLISEASELGYKIDEYQIDELLNRRLGADPKSNLPEAARELEQFKELLRSAREGKLVRREIQTPMLTGEQKIANTAELKRAEQLAIESGVNPADIDVVYEDVDVPGQMAAVVRQKLYKQDPETGALIDNGYKKLASRLIEPDEVPKIKTTTEEVRAGGKNLSNLEEMHQLYKDLREKSQFGDQGYKSAEVRRMTGETIEDIQKLLRTGNLEGDAIPGQGVPFLSETDQAIHKYNKALEKFGVTDSQNMDVDKVRDRLISMMGQEGKMNVSAVKAQEHIDDFLKEIGTVNPTMAKKMSSEIGDAGKLMNTMQHINRPMSSAVNALNPLAWSRAFATGGANVAGVATRGVKDIGREGVAKVSQMTPDWLKQQATALAQSSKPAAQELSNLLIKVADKDDRSRNATLAVLLQNPAYRQMLGLSDTNKENAQ